MAVLWVTGLAESQVRGKLQGKDLRKYESIIISPDLRSKPWAQDLIQQLRGAGVPIYAYVRAPVHYRLTPSSPGQGEQPSYEYTIKQLIEGAGAALKRTDTGQQAKTPAGYDGYVLPWKVAQQHAQVTAQMLGDGFFSGILADGLVTNQLYASDPSHSDYDENGRAVDPNNTAGWARLGQKQLAALQEWATTLKQMAPGLKIIGNGAWEPKAVKYQRNQQGVWQFDPNTATWEESGWMNLIDGVMDEGEARPYYHGASPYQQLPASLRNELHRRAAQAWLAQGKSYWLGGRATSTNFPSGVSYVNDNWNYKPATWKPPVTPPPVRPPPGTDWGTSQRSTWLTPAQKTTLQRLGKKEFDFWRPPLSYPGTGNNPFQNWLFDPQTGKVLTTSGSLRSWREMSLEHQQLLQRAPWWSIVPPIEGGPNWQPPNPQLPLVLDRVGQGQQIWGYLLRIRGAIHRWLNTILTPFQDGVTGR